MLRLPVRLCLCLGDPALDVQYLAPSVGPVLWWLPYEAGAFCCGNAVLHQFGPSDISVVFAKDDLVTTE